jgi:hypothetical protein
VRSESEHSIKSTKIDDFDGDRTESKFSGRNELIASFLLQWKPSVFPVAGRIKSKVDHTQQGVVVGGFD